MDSTNFDQLFQSLKEGAETVAKTSLADYVKQAKKDGQEALDSLKTDLQRWTEEAENGALTKEDLAFLLEEEAALGEMKSLKQAGLAEVQIDKFRNGLITMITSTLLGAIRV